MCMRNLALNQFYLRDHSAFYYIKLIGELRIAVGLWV